MIQQDPKREFKKVYGAGKPWLDGEILLMNSVSNTETCYYLENKVLGSVTNQDMSLIETCFYSRLYGMYRICKWSIYVQNSCLV